LRKRRRALWEERHRGKPPGAAEPFLVEVLPLLPHGLALDIAAGRGRNSLAMARAGMKVIAADYSREALSVMAAAAREENLPIWPVVVDLDRCTGMPTNFDVVVNINFLSRRLFPVLIGALKPGGFLVADTFLVDQAESGHPHDRRFLLKHFELRRLLAGLELIRYREGITEYPDGVRAWRASALARRRD